MWTGKRVGPREWAGLAAAVLAVVSLLLPWTNLTADDPELLDALAELPAADVGRDVWSSGFFAWAPMLLLIVAGVVVTALGQVPAARRAGLPQLWLVCACVVAALAVLGWFTMGWQFGSEQRAFLEEAGVLFTAGPGRYLGSLAALVWLVAAVLDVRVVRAETRSSRRARRRGHSSIRKWR